MKPAHGNQSQSILTSALLGGLLLAQVVSAAFPSSNAGSIKLRGDSGHSTAQAQGLLHPYAGEAVALNEDEENGGNSTAGATGNSDEHSPWSYTTDSPKGPENWAKVASPHCDSSVFGNQSPVNLVQSPPKQESQGDAPTTRVFKPQYKKAAGKLINNGHTLKVAFEAGAAGHVEHMGVKYELVQFHFHSPSEHVVGTRHQNGHSMMEMHLVHAPNHDDMLMSTDGSLKPLQVVVGIMINKGDSNGFLGDVFSKMPEKSNNDLAEADLPASEELDIPGVIGPLIQEQSYYTYRGSLTTPPCSENVRWFVMKKEWAASEEQQQAFMKKMPASIQDSGNARPILPLNTRVVTLVGVIKE